MKLKRKNKILIFGFACTLYLCYALAFSNTIEYYRKYSSQKQMISANVSDPVMMRQLITKETQLDTILSQYSTSNGETFQNDLLEQLSTLSNKYHLKIIDFKEPHIHTSKNIRSYSYIFSLEGSFNGILLLINNVENNASLGYIKHIAFIKRKNYKTNSDYLTGEIILQKNQSLKKAN
jgi:hypothetical protein